MGEIICNECYKEFSQYEFDNNDDNNCEEVFSVYKYKNLIRNLIIDYKFYDKSYLKCLFVKLITNHEEAFNFINSCDIIIPVPLHKKRRQERGFNQTELIAKDIARLLKKDYCKNVLIKVKNINPQSKQKSAKDRIKNVDGAFKVTDNNNIKNIIKDKKVLLFDDVYTTGSTFKECKKVLLDNGAYKVSILTISRD